MKLYPFTLYLDINDQINRVYVITQSISFDWVIFEWLLNSKNLMSGKRKREVMKNQRIRGPI